MVTKVQHSPLDKLELASLRGNVERLRILPLGHEDAKARPLLKRNLFQVGVVHEPGLKMQHLSANKLELASL